MALQLANAVAKAPMTMRADSAHHSRRMLLLSLIEQHLDQAEELLAIGSDAVADIDALGLSCAEANDCAEASTRLGSDRFGRIGAVIFDAGDVAARTASQMTANLRAVIEHAFHDAQLVVLWNGSEDDDPDFSAADAAILDASDWRPHASGPIIQRA